ncbi:MAG TPA: Uma2 family endonuclease [Clostridiales bacterium]|nr:Uma2 family endonuclease [Clostridiales bacterium]
MPYFPSNIENVPMHICIFFAYDYAPKEISYEEFIERYEKTEERLEYIDSRVYAMGSPNHTHQSIVGYLFNSFYTFFNGKECKPFVAPYDIHFENSHNKACVQPDIFVMCDKENLRDGKYYGVPALVVEVLSPASCTKDTMTKLNLYWREGVSEYLLVEPREQIVYYWYFREKELIIQKTLGVEHVLKSNMFSGLEIKISEIFQSIY